MNETLTKIQELEQRQQETEQFKETVFAEVLPLIIKLCTEVRAKVKNSTLPNFTADCSPYIDLRIIDLQVREDDVVIHYEEDEEDCTTVHTSFFKVSKELFNPELTSLVIAKRVQEEERIYNNKLDAASKKAIEEKTAQIQKLQEEISKLQE